MPRASRRLLPRRMSILSVRQSLQGIACALKARNLAIADRLELIRHQAVLLDELRQIDLGRRKQRAKTQAEA
jgi:hypothetical protein